MEAWRAFIYIVYVIHLTVTATEYGECLKGRPDFLPGIVQSFYAGINATECELAQNTEFKQYDPSNNEVFDFIVIGAGASGSVMANKLSSNPNLRVLLLEAGGDPTSTTEIPGLVFFSLGSNLDWSYNTVPEDGIYWGYPKGGSVNWPRGKGLAGSTLLNFMFYTRGNPDDYNKWQTAGNDGWGYNDLLPHFTKMEQMKAKEVLSCDSCRKYHGTDGELYVESFTNSQLDTYGQAISDGMKTLGLGLYPDYNNPEMLKKGGFYFIQGTKKNGKRCNAAKAFLKPVQDRTNLRISKQSLATKILIDKNNVAYGVEFNNRFNKKIRVLANKEIVASCGAINTPQLMMLSGVGPQKHLQALGINVVKHVPGVGANLQDHPGFTGIIISVNKDEPPSDKTLVDQLFEYFTTTTGDMGVLGSVLGSNAAFVNSGVSKDEYPDVELLFSKFDKNSATTVAQSYGAYSQDVVKLFTDLNDKPLIQVRAVLLRPKSKGRVFLNKNNPADKPKLYGGYFSDQDDFLPIIGAIRLLEKVVASKPMQDIGAKLELVDYPRCKQFKAFSDDYWACAVRYLVGTTYHQCCTMKMGPDSDKRAVVDSELRMKGISNLRVVDLSVSPTLVSAHTQATAYVIADKIGGDMVVQYANN